MTGISKDVATVATVHLWRSSMLRWGVSDCIMSCADHALLITGKDPAATWRGAYASPEEAADILNSAGGGAALMGLGLATIGVAQTDAPVYGDLICAQLGPHEIGGLCLGGKGIFRRPAGTVELPLRAFKLLGAWEL